MTTSTIESREVRALSVEVDDDTLSVELSDGRTISVPLAWYPRLSHSTLAERRVCQIFGNGIHWPKIDEDVSVTNLLAGQPSGESQRSFKKWLESRGSRPARREPAAVKKQRQPRS